MKCGPWFRCRLHLWLAVAPVSLSVSAWADGPGTGTLGRLVGAELGTASVVARAELARRSLQRGWCLLGHGPRRGGGSSSGARDRCQSGAGQFRRSSDRCRHGIGYGLGLALPYDSTQPERVGLVAGSAGLLAGAVALDYKLNLSSGEGLHLPVLMSSAGALVGGVEGALLASPWLTARLR